MLDPNRVPTIPFSTRLGPVPVRVPTCILISLLHYSLTLPTPASVGSIGDREIKKFSDFPSFHLLHFALGLNNSGPKTEGNVSTKGRFPGPFWMNFRKTSEGGKGGGSFPIQKISLRFFGNFGGVKTMNFRKKGGGHANPNEFRCKFLGLPKQAQHSFPKIGWGGQRPFGSFPKIHRIW